MHGARASMGSAPYRGGLKLTMMHPQRFACHILVWFTALLWLTVFTLPVLAQQGSQTAGATSKASWVLSYAIVVLGIGLGLAGICRPGRRAKEIK